MNVLDSLPEVEIGHCLQDDVQLVCLLTGQHVKELSGDLQMQMSLLSLRLSELVLLKIS